MATEVHVYVDVAFLANFVVDLAWLWVTASLAGVRVRVWRVVAAAAVGAAAAVWAWFPSGRWIQTWPAVAAGTLVVLAGAFWPFRVREALRLAGTFLFTGAALAGVVTLVDHRFGHREAPFASMLVAAGLAVGLVGVRYIWAAIRERRQMVRGLYGLQVRLGGHAVELPALLDTGHSLAAPLTGTPVAVVELACLEPWLPGGLAQAAGRGWEALAQLPDSLAARCRLIPYQALGQPEGVLLAIVPDGLAVRAPGAQGWQPVGGLVGLAPAPLHPDGVYRALLPPKLIESAEAIPGIAWEGETG